MEVVCKVKQSTDHLVRLSGGLVNPGFHALGFNGDHAFLCEESLCRYVELLQVSITPVSPVMLLWGICMAQQIYFRYFNSGFEFKYLENIRTGSDRMNQMAKKTPLHYRLRVPKMEKLVYLALQCSQMGVGTWR